MKEVVRLKEENELNDRCLALQKNPGPSATRKKCKPVAPVGSQGQALADPRHDLTRTTVLLCENEPSEEELELHIIVLRCITNMDVLIWL